MCLGGQLHYFRWLFWWLFVSNFCGSGCGTLQSGNELYQCADKRLMRHNAHECIPLQNAKKRTQNPPRATSWGFDPPPGTIYCSQYIRLN
jgi:hypothetical protein